MTRDELISYYVEKMKEHTLLIQSEDIENTTEEVESTNVSVDTE